MKENLTKCTTLEIVKIQSDLIGNNELTKMFDIDHLYLARYNVNKEGKYEFDPESAEGLQNSIIESILTVLKDKNHLTSCISLLIMILNL